MLILWILFGVVIGMILAYLWLGKQHRKAMADLEGSWYEKVRRAEDAAAKAMAEAEAIKAGDDPKTVSLRRVDEPATEVASGAASGAASGVAPGVASESSVVAAQEARPGNGSAAANGGAVAAFTGEAVAEDEDLDDLTRISGVGPVLQEKLYRLGITTYQQIAEMTPEDIARVDEVLDFPGRVEREDWVGQARKMLDGQQHA